MTTKVRVAQEKGAHAVIIVDRDDSQLTAKDLVNVVVTDDGYGDLVKIPSVFISKEDGLRLIQALLYSPVVVELEWKLPSMHVVKFDWWISTASKESYRLLKEFAPKRRVLNEVLNFQPHYAVFGVDGTQRLMFNHLCMDDESKLCAEDPDGAGPITGVDVLQESVRQLCIHEVHKVYHETTFSYKDMLPWGVSFSAKFWDYVEKFAETCPLDGKSADSRFGTQCSVKLMNQVGVDVARVDSCARANSTIYLQRERDNPAWSTRALRINGWRYSGILDADLITKAICSGFVEVPVECKVLNKARDPFVHYAPQGVSFKELIGWLLGLSAVMGVLMLCYRRYLRTEMQRALREEVMLEVQAQMGEYTKMSGSKA